MKTFIQIQFKLVLMMTALAMVFCVGSRLTKVDPTHSNHLTSAHREVIVSPIKMA